MPLSKKRTYQRQSEPKLFQCTGYGDCHMVFTRSEHLARHARKHTGEKPYKCVVPGCERTFSRFDNMIQHTSTHNKKGNGDKKGVQNKKPNSSKQTNTMKTDVSQNDKSIRPQNMVSHITSPVDMGYSSLSPPPTSTLSLPGSPISDMGSPSYQRLPSISDSYFHHSPNAPTLMEFFSHITPISPMHPTFLPSPKELLHPLYPMKSASDFDDNDALSSSASPSPASSPLPSPLSPTSILLHPSSDDLSRRLSNMELALPIQELSTCHGAGANGVNVTRDEFEALQGFSQLATRSFGANRPRSVDMGATQVNALRQSLALAHESSSRLSPRSSI